VRITRGRRWTWVVALLLALVGVVLCFTTVARLLTFVGWALLAFQVGLLLFLLASWPYFWSGPLAAPAPAPDALGPGGVEPAEAPVAPAADSEASLSESKPAS
jgi:hypothetical protein